MLVQSLSESIASQIQNLLTARLQSTTAPMRPMEAPAPWSLCFRSIRFHFLSFPLWQLQDRRQYHRRSNHLMAGPAVCAARRHLCLDPDPAIVAETPSLRRQQSRVLPSQRLQPPP